MSVIDIDELHQDTAAVLRRVRDQSESIAISDNGEIVAHIVPKSSTRATWMGVDQLAERLAHPPIARSPEERATRRAQTEDALLRLKQLGAEISATWPPDVAAVDAIRDVRREL